jgi:hypothetical protein
MFILRHMAELPVNGLRSFITTYLRALREEKTHFDREMKLMYTVLQPSETLCGDA